MKCPGTATVGARDSIPAKGSKKREDERGIGIPRPIPTLTRPLPKGVVNSGPNQGVPGFKKFRRKAKDWPRIASSEHWVGRRT
jgi:hypothetical protein